MTAVLALDLETSGLPPAGIALGSPNFPWPVAVGAILFDLDGAEAAIFGSHINAAGRKMQPAAVAIHGITDRDAGRGGISEIAALSVVCGFAAQARMLVGYSVQFDRDICESALLRLGKDSRMLVRPGLEVIDLKLASTGVCQIPSDHELGGYRWPSLDKACEIILGEPPREGKHNALTDAGRCKRLFLALVARGAIEVRE